MTRTFWQTYYQSMSVEMAALASLPILCCYSLALVRGLTFARNDQHRLAPLSPWSCLWLGGKKWFLRAIICIPLYIPLKILLQCVLSRLLEADLIGSSNLINPLGFMRAVSTSYGQYFYLLLFSTEYLPEYRGLSTFQSMHGLAELCLALGAMTLAAPRITQASLLGTIGLLLMIPSVYLSNPPWDGFGLHPEVHLILASMISSIEVLILPLTWLYARYVLNRRWFRFPEG